MGNRATIVFDEYKGGANQTALYLHWNGGRSSIEGFLKATRILMDSRGQDESYNRARLTQVIGIYLVGNLSFGLMENAFDPGDNGIYVIDSATLEIIERPDFDGTEDMDYDLNEFTNDVLSYVNAVYEKAGNTPLPTAEEYDAEKAK
jgi:hypothetical protein